MKITVMTGSEANEVKRLVRENDKCALRILHREYTMKGNSATAFVVVMMVVASLLLWGVMDGRRDLGFFFVVLSALTVAAGVFSGHVNHRRRLIGYALDQKKDESATHHCCEDQKDE